MVIMPLKSHKLSFRNENHLNWHTCTMCFIRLSGNYIAKIKLVKILNPLLTYTPVISGSVSDAL